MEFYLTCPHCGEKFKVIGVEVDGNDLGSSNNMPSNDGLTKALEKAHIELAAARREGNDA